MNKKSKLKNYSKDSPSDSDEITRMIKIFGLVVGVFLVVYLVMAIVNGEIKLFPEKKEEEVVVIQDIEIMAGTTFNRLEDKYYVMFYEFEKYDSSTSDIIYNVYTMKEDATKMYKVDLKKSFNKVYLTEDRSLVDVKGIERLKVLNPTLILVENGNAKILASGEEELLNYREILLK